MHRAPTVVAIIPAFNEESTIGPVVRVLVHVSSIDEVVVVSDGSTDKTVEIAENEGARVIEVKENKGKGQTMKRGVEETDQEIVAFFDADLLGLSVGEVECMLEPVVSGELAMCVGIRDRGPIISRIGQQLPYITGERAMIREVCEGVPDRYYKGFMIESPFNYYCRTRRLPYNSVVLKGVSIRRKMQKVGFWKGLLGYAHMFYQVGISYAAVRISYLLGKF
jgi:polyisoprenyl-phosphate glycosyltransferase